MWIFSWNMCLTDYQVCQCCNLSKSFNNSFSRFDTFAPSLPNNSQSSTQSSLVINFSEKLHSIEKFLLLASDTESAFPQHLFPSICCNRWESSFPNRTRRINLFSMETCINARRSSDIKSDALFRARHDFFSAQHRSKNVWNDRFSFWFTRQSGDEKLSAYEVSLWRLWESTTFIECRMVVYDKSWRAVCDSLFKHSILLTLILNNMIASGLSSSNWKTSLIFYVSKGHCCLCWELESNECPRGTKVTESFSSFL